MSNRKFLADLRFLSMTSWNDIGDAPKDKVGDLPRVILLRGRYESGRETLPVACWWDDVNNRWSGWPYAEVQPSHWMEIVPLPAVAELTIEEAAP